MTTALTAGLTPLPKSRFSLRKEFSISLELRPGNQDILHLQVAFQFSLMAYKTSQILFFLNIWGPLHWFMWQSDTAYWWLRDWNSLVAHSMEPRAGEQPGHEGWWEMHAVLCCSPMSALGPDHIRCVESAGLYLEGGGRLQHIPGNNQVLFTAERGLKGLCKMMGGKRAAPMEKSLLFKKSLHEVTTQSKHGTVSLEKLQSQQHSARSHLTVLPRLIFSGMLLP